MREEMIKIPTNKKANISSSVSHQDKVWLDYVAREHKTTRAAVVHDLIRVYLEAAGCTEPNYTPQAVLGIQELKVETRKTINTRRAGHYGLIVDNKQLD